MKSFLSHPQGFNGYRLARNYCGIINEAVLLVQRFHTEFTRLDELGS